MKIIQLTQGFATLVDDDDFELLGQYRWKILKVGPKRYACRSKRHGAGYVTILMHREILGLKRQGGRAQQADHANGDGLDNRRCNLRICSSAQNNANKKKWTGASSYKGVSWSASRCRWMAQLGAGLHASGKQAVRFLGRFRTQEEAAYAYNQAALNQYAEFAVLNQLPQGWTPPDIALALKRGRLR